MVKSIYIISLIVLLFTKGTICFAQQMPDTYSEFTYGKLEYGLFIPANYDSSKTYPLVMYLHGWSNNYTVYLNFYNREFQTKNPCFVYTPKTPVDWGDWSSWSWEGTGFSSLSVPTQTAMYMLDSLISKYSIDTNRLYIYGISMGGEGVFDLLHKMPNKFAAGISICGGGFAHWADKISSTPFWMFHGSKDEINPPDLTERVFNKLLEIGATNMRYTNYSGYGHSIWDKAQAEPSFYDWMFSFNKNLKEYKAPQGDIKLSGIVTNKINLQWNDIRDESIPADKIWYYNVFNSKGLLATIEYNVRTYSFTPANIIDTFKVQAVNYWFQKSDFSNHLYYNEGIISTIGVDYNPIIPKEYRLEQNHPNPFNPETIIKYSIPSTEYVSLRVYDLLGKEIETLVNERKQAGEHLVNFNGSSLTSGVYFYKLIYEGNIETKKMILLK